MNLASIDIQRIIFHQTYKTAPDGTKKAPYQSQTLTAFDQKALATFKERVIGALGQDSRAVEMEIVNFDATGLPSLVNQLLQANDTDFINLSYKVAVQLTAAQSNRSIPGGVVVVFTGVRGSSQEKFLGIIKADVYSAYEKHEDPKTHEISLEYIEEVLLTPSSKLYKTAGFFEKSTSGSPPKDLKEQFRVFVSDSQISQSDGKAAAKYFYKDFLGCDYPHTSARVTKQFFDLTKIFIADLDIDEYKKHDYLTALNTYLRIDTGSSASVSEFSQRYFDTNTGDAYKVFATKAGMPLTAFAKNTEHIERPLKQRKVKFKSDVKITGSSDAFRKLITFEVFDSDIQTGDGPEKWTKIIVKDTIAFEE